MAHPPIYPHPLEYADAHGELDAFYENMAATRACMQGIDTAVRESYRGDYRYDLKTAAKTVIEAHGFERLNYVLANILLNHHYDGRYSRDNQEWARSFGIVADRYIFCNTHPAVLDGFIGTVRIAQREMNAEKKPSAMEKLETAKQAVAPPSPGKAAAKPGPER